MGSPQYWAIRLGLPKTFLTTPCRQSATNLPLADGKEFSETFKYSLTRVYTKDKNKVVTTLMITDRHPKQMLTIKELAELFGINRQAMRKHVDILETTYLAKNIHGYKVYIPFHTTFDTLVNYNQIHN